MEVWVRFTRLRPLLTLPRVLPGQRSPGIGTHLCRQLVLRRFRFYRLRNWYFLAPGQGSEEGIRVLSAGTARVLRPLPGTRLAYLAADDGLVPGGTLLVGPPEEFLGLGRKPVEGFLDEGVVLHQQPGNVRQRSVDPSKSLVGDAQTLDGLHGLDKLLLADGQLLLGQGANLVLNVPLLLLDGQLPQADA